MRKRKRKNGSFEKQTIPPIAVISLENGNTMVKWTNLISEQGTGSIYREPDVSNHHYARAT